MKTFRMIGMALVAVLLGFAMSSCENDDEVDPYKDYPQLIIGKWFNFTPEVSMLAEYKTDGTFYQIGYAPIKDEWRNRSGKYTINENHIIGEFSGEATTTNIKVVELTNDKFSFEVVESQVSTLYRAKEQFDIKGNYSYLNSVARVVPAAGKTALQLPEGVTFNGQNSISIDAMHGERIIAAMQKFFADATFADGGKLNHKMDGETKTKSYTHNGNSLTFDLYEGGSYKVNATTFPDEDGDRLFIIIPKQAAWLGGMVDLVEKENEGLTLDAAQIAALEKEFMDTFETFTVILSLSKK